jgi:PAS domain S-box-containing protein
MLSANMVPSHRGQASVVFSTRHQDRTMRAHDYPLVETPDFLLAVLERASEAVVIADGDLRVSHFNAAAELIWELDRAQVLGCHVSRLGLQDLQQPHVANGDEAARGGNSRITIQRKDGSRIRAAVSLSRIEAGSQSHAIAFVRDVSTEVDLQEKLALLTLIADGTFERRYSARFIIVQNSRVEMTGDAEVSANNLDKVRIALGRPNGSHMADKPKQEARDPKAQTDAERGGERAVDDSDGARRAAHQDRLGQCAMHGRDEAWDFCIHQITTPPPNEKNDK